MQLKIIFVSQFDNIIIIILLYYYRKDTHLAEGVLKCMSLLFKSSSVTSDKPFFELLSIFLAMIENDESAPVEPRLSQCNELKFFNRFISFSF